MKKEIIEKLSALITTASGLVAALAWNSAIQGIFDRYYAGGIIPMLIYAILISIVAIILTIWIGRVSKKNSKKEDKK